jgi:hypothetical protein
MAEVAHHCGAIIVAESRYELLLLPTTSSYQIRNTLCKY